MNLRVTTAALAAVTALCVLAFVYVLRQVSFVSLGFAGQEEVEEELRRSLDDQKKLAKLDPESEQEYRKRFESTQELMHNLHVLALSRQQIARRIELVLAGVATLVLAGAMALFLTERRRIQAAQQQRLRYLEHLSAWQEAARRHAHEIRTPLTCAQMEVERLVRVARDGGSEEELSEARKSVLDELKRLNEFTRNFTSFASVPKPKAQAVDLDRMAGEFCSTFAGAWPELTLQRDGKSASVTAQIDRDMIGQVLVNLCNNSALAGAHMVRMRVQRNGTAAFLDVSDDGPGVPAELRRTIFEPYVTTRPIGEGMGLGLAISKKILLDHGGDLDLVSSSRGATFRLTLPLESPS